MSIHNFIYFYEMTSDDVTINTTCYGSPPGQSPDSVRLRCDAVESWALLDDGADVVTTSGTVYQFRIKPGNGDNDLWTSLVECLDGAVTR